ncbi:mfs monocarboxylate transporter [Fusarium napiforme]|uniref:Mfs monocarboxylate transporter n=1 Tax=Fusarium napiforme TaxID=42672 RepID=A0A8H5N0R4_9HYPO|nr:mfs monocarboxylate transporter [Fusarium napiforme]
MLNSAKSPPQLPEAWEPEPLVNQQEEAVGAPIIPRVAWLVAENQLCNDAQADAVILRARPWKKEMNNMFSQSDREPDLISTESNPHATSQDRGLANYINHQIQDRFNKPSACRGPTTLSEYAKKLSRENPAQWNDYLHAYRQKITDPEAFNLNRVDNEQHARELLTYSRRQFDRCLLLYAGYIWSDQEPYWARIQLYCP